MTSVRVVIAAALACLCWLPPPPPAAAHPVSGGGRFSDAPTLEAGSFGDSLLPRETLFYGVRLLPGQRLRARVSVDLRPTSRYAGYLPRGGRLDLTLYSPLRQELKIEIGSDSGDLERPSDVIAGPRVLTAAAAARKAANSDGYAGPGIYYVSVVMTETVVDSGATVELPVRLDVDTGAAEPAMATATAGGAGRGPLEERSAAVSPAARSSPGRGGAARGTPAVTFGLAGAGGLIPGIALGLLVVRARRRRS